MKMLILRCFNINLTSQILKQNVILLCTTKGQPEKNIFYIFLLIKWPLHSQIIYIQEKNIFNSYDLFNYYIYLKL